MVNVTIKEIAEAVQGTVLCGDPDTIIEHVSIDSRTMQGNDIFLPFIGAKVDAHRFIDGAFKAGAAAAFTMEHEEMEDSHPFIRVEDSLKALQALGAWYRRRYSGMVIGITGSVGKTSTRAMIMAALGAAMKVTGTAGNNNGQIGVPITVTELSNSFDAAVIEMGVSEPGEMSRINRIAWPSHAVVTNIGDAHIENLGSREGIAKEKLQIADLMPPKGCLILNGDDDMLLKMGRDYHDRVLYYGLSETNDLRAENIHREVNETVFTAKLGRKEKEIRLSVPGEHQVMNALAALAVCEVMSVSWDKAAEGIASYTGFSHRLEIIKTAAAVYVDDTYNASPASMKAALGVLSDMQTDGRRIAVLADMLELGPDEARLHYETGVYGASKKVDHVVVIGELAKQIGKAYAEHNIPVSSFEDNASAIEFLNGFKKPGDVILLKGSHGMNLLEVLHALTEADKD
ncbi:MAG: UDP-N-acetylmuramoyl-tripeptide--D-alanyl-D-alanine ligase [Lachnospiraceae bacterium]|nr:UDP-N-acetylmuramoyl-tripeptide--D-alanyl-D-alanine ligase [Lachnospiraceae bacterium]